MSKLRMLYPPRSPSGVDAAAASTTLSQPVSPTRFCPRNGELDFVRAGATHSRQWIDTYPHHGAANNGSTTRLLAAQRRRKRGLAH